MNTIYRKCYLVRTFWCNRARRPSFNKLISDSICKQTSTLIRLLSSKLLKMARSAKLFGLQWQWAPSKCADVLATMGCSFTYDIVFYANCPGLISDVYTADIRGSSIPRLIALLSFFLFIYFSLSCCPLFIIKKKEFFNVKKRKILDGNI
jgi:hypothetical protein